MFPEERIDRNIRRAETMIESKAYYGQTLQRIKTGSFGSKGVIRDERREDLFVKRNPNNKTVIKK